MADRGMTREERTSATSALDEIALRCDQLGESIRELLGSLPQHPDRAGAAGERWVALANTIAQRLKNLSDVVAPHLDHWVFEPVNAGHLNQASQLPELLRTKLTEEQEQRDQELTRQLGSMHQQLATLIDRQKKINEATVRLANGISSDPSLEAIMSKRKRMNEALPALTKRQEQVNALPLLRYYKRGERQGIRVEEPL